MNRIDLGGARGDGFGFEVAMDYSMNPTEMGFLWNDWIGSGENPRVWRELGISKDDLLRGVWCMNPGAKKVGNRKLFNNLWFGPKMKRFSIGLFWQTESGYLPLRFDLFTLSNIERACYLRITLLHDWHFNGDFYLRYLQNIRIDYQISIEGLSRLHSHHKIKFGKWYFALIFDRITRLISFLLTSLLFGNCLICYDLMRGDGISKYLGIDTANKYCDSRNIVYIGIEETWMYSSTLVSLLCYLSILTGFLFTCFRCLWFIMTQGQWLTKSGGKRLRQPRQF